MLCSRELKSSNSRNQKSKQPPEPTQAKFTKMFFLNI